MSQDLAPQLPSDVVSACVVAGAVDTPYQAAGRGAPVVILSDAPRRLATLLTRLPRRLRVVAPTLRAGEPPARAAATDFSGWLGSFLDALGVARVALVADSWLAAPAVGFALLDPARVARVALLQSGPPVVGVTDGGIADRLASGGALMASWLDDGGDEGSTERAVSELAAFLEG